MLADQPQDVIESFMQQWTAAPTVEEQALHIMHALDSWTADMHALSFASAGFQVTAEERKALAIAWGSFSFPEGYATAAAAWANAIEAFGEMRDGKGMRLCDVDAIASLTIRATAFIEGLPFEAPFFKLGTTSPKNSPFWQICRGRVRNGEEALLLLLTSSRAASDFGIADINAPVAAVRDAALLGEYGDDDSALVPRNAESTFPDGLTVGEAKALSADAVDYLPWLWFRAYRRIPEYAEFRCFMRNRKYYGGSQVHRISRRPYQHDGTGGELLSADPFRELMAEDPATGEMGGYKYDRAVRDWFPSFEAAAPFDDCVFDVAVNLDAGTVTLIETNAFLKSTFPGLKDWNDPRSFDNKEIDWCPEPIRNTAVRIGRREMDALAKLAHDSRFGLLPQSR